MMAAFANLEDTPMFRKQLYSLESSAEELKGRCQKFHKGCKGLTGSLGQAYEADIGFAESLEAFGAGHDDPLSVAIGGPVMSKFTSVFKELGTYKELLHTQVEHMLSNRLMEFINVDLHNTKDSRRRFEKAQLAYDQALEKFMSLKRGTRPDIITELEEDLHNSKSAYERCRFNLVSALMNIEAKKKYEFLESVSAVMDAHLRYFKQGHELFSQMEQFIHQVLTYSLQSKEMTAIERDNLEKRIQEFRTQEEMDSSRSSNNGQTSTNGDGIHVIGVNSYKSIEALMQSTTNGEVQTIKQGYLLKRSSKKGDWKRKFFVLDSRGALYFYKNTSSKQGSLQLQSNSILEHGSGVLGRFRFSHQKSPSLEEEKLSYKTIDLRTSTIKMDAEQTDLRFCFRLISPSKTYSLQAENGTERTDWIDKITAVIASLLNSPFLKQRSFRHVDVDTFPAKTQVPDIMNTGIARKQSISVELRSIPGNDVCAECNSPEPEWASLNIGVLLCIECSGVHRNLGVHISKVRSLTLDVKIWEPAILDLFRALGNSYCNSVWEQALWEKPESMEAFKEFHAPISKPEPRDSISIKEKYIQLKYVEKYFVVNSMEEVTIPVANRIWDAVKSGDIRAAYHALVALSADPNIKYDLININGLPHVDRREQTSNDTVDRWQYNPASCARINSNTDQAECLQGCSALHLACHVDNMVMVELLLQFGADINMQDFHGRTPLHHCVSKRNNVLAKYLIRRGANLTIKDGGGQTALERAMEFGPITDEELLILLVGSE